MVEKSLPDSITNAHEVSKRGTVYVGSIYFAVWYPGTK